jgi:hypothetical protein
MRTIAGLIVTVGNPGRVPYDGNKSKTFRPIPGIENDRLIVRTLLSRAMVGLNAHVGPFKDVREPDAETLKLEVRNAINALEDGDLFLLVLSGHGFQIDERAPSQVGLAGLSAETTEAFATVGSYVHGGDLGDILRTEKPGLTIFSIIDACSADGQLWIIRRLRRLVWRAGSLTRSETQVLPDENKQHATHISIGAAKEKQNAETGVEAGRYRGELVAALLKTWNPTRGTYREWLTAAGDLVAAKGAQNPVVRVGGFDVGVVDGPPFSSAVGAPDR